MRDGREGEGKEGSCHNVTYIEIRTRPMIPGGTPPDAVPRTMLKSYKMQKIIIILKKKSVKCQSSLPIQLISHTSHTTCTCCAHFLHIVHWTCIQSECHKHLHIPSH